MSGADVGRRVGISRQYVNRMRAGEVATVRYDLARRIERALAVRAGDLFDYVPASAEPDAIDLDPGDVGAGLIASMRERQPDDDGATS